MVGFITTSHSLFEPCHTYTVLGLLTLHQITIHRYYYDIMHSLSLALLRYPIP